MTDARDPSSAIALEHAERLRHVELERFRLLASGPMVAPGQKPIAGWQFVRATSNRRQGERLARLAAYVGRRAGRPIRVLELGTSVGISGMYLLSGMAEAHGGHLATFEGRADIARSAQARMDAFVRRFGLGDRVSFEIVLGSFADTYEPHLQANREPLDLVFIDGHHQAEPTLRYHALARERLAPHGVIVHDDIAWTAAMAGAWASLCERERDHLILELWQGGRPSRGVIYLGEPPRAERPRIDLDRVPERLARRLWRVASRFRR